MNEFVTEEKYYDEEDIVATYESECLRIDFENSTLEIISKVAYLLGVPKRIFENPHQHPQIDVFENLEQDKAARIIRHLCIVRHCIERGYKQIRDSMRNEGRSFLTSGHIPPETLVQLQEDGVVFFKKCNNNHLFDHVIEINKLIKDRINNCQKLFPLWIKFEYIKDLFIMEDGLRQSGTEEAAKIFYDHLAMYPYKMYMNWRPKEEGNVLYNDKKFLTLLYEWNGDVFREYSKVSDASRFVKNSIFDFINESEKISLLVDCENSDPYKLCSTLKALQSDYLKKIASIILFDDVHAASAWDILTNYTDIPVQHITISRLKANKSLVDATLIAKACQLHYQQAVDSFILVSSDSDYWALIENMQSARFMFLVERNHCGVDLKRALVESKIFYCYIDDFFSGNNDIAYSAIFRELHRYIDSCNIKLNIHEMFNEALRATRVHMTESEKKQFFDKYIKTMQMRIDENGNVVFEFKPFR